MNKLKKIGALLLTVLLVVSLSACAGAPTASSEASSAASSAVSSEAPVFSEAASAPSSKASSEAAVSSEATGASATLTDREGKEIAIPAQINRIISMAPSITETLINLGLGDKIVAVDTYSTDTDGLPENLPAFDMMTPDTESITALKPDIIFATGMSMAGGEDPFKSVTDLGALMTYIPSATSIDGIKQDIKFLGDITGTADKAAQIVSQMESRIAAITAKVPAGAGKTVYFEIAPAPSAYSFGTGTFLNEMIELLGCTNVLADQKSWVSVSEEIILDKNPDVIFTNVGYMDDPDEEILARNGWSVINAVKNRQVFEIDTDDSSLPNENIVDAMEEMAEDLYPEVFK